MQITELLAGLVPRQVTIHGHSDSIFNQLPRLTETDNPSKGRDKEYSINQFHLDH